MYIDLKSGGTQVNGTHVLAGLYPCNVFANAFGCRAKEAARQAVGFVAAATTAARAATRFDLCNELDIVAPRKATNLVSLLVFCFF